MWTMVCNDGGEICLPTNNDSFSCCRKLRPLIPRPPPNPSANSPNHHHHHRHHHHHHYHGHGSCDPDNHGLFALNHHHHLVTMAEQSKRDFNAAHQVVVCSRWNPKPEQLQVLEEMYRQGTQTPSADQIQQITSQLRRYGKIEGKNVFYWFQNHKARERQKRRREMEYCSRAEEEKGHLNNQREAGNLQCKESGRDSGNTASDDVRRANKNNNTPTDNSNNSYNWEAGEGSNMDKGEKSVMAGEGGGSASASSSATAVKATSTSSASSTAVVTSLWMKINDTRELLPNSSLIITGNSMNNYDNLRRNATCPRLLPTPGPVVLPISSTTGHTILTALHSSSPPLPFPSQDIQTLQLFPLRSEEYEDRVCYVEEDDHLRPQFFEFLPMKN